MEKLNNFGRTLDNACLTNIGDDIKDLVAIEGMKAAQSEDGDEESDKLITIANFSNGNIPFGGISIEQPEISKKISEILSLDADPIIQIPLEVIIELAYDSKNQEYITFVKNLIENNNVGHITMSLHDLYNIYDTDS